MLADGREVVRFIGEDGVVVARNYVNWLRENNYPTVLSEVTRFPAGSVEMEITFKRKKGVIDQAT